MEKTIGVLSVQGAFEEHIKSLRQLDVHCVEIRKRSDLTDHSFDGIVLPGGESTVMGKLIRELELFDPLKQFIEKGFPILGTCAGLILLAEKIADDDTVHFAAMDIVARRNAYGRQLGSFQVDEQFGTLGKIPMIFIRAPYIESVGEKVEVLARVDGHIVAAQQDNMVVTSFHPELTDDLTVHQYFLDLISFHKKPEPL